MSRYVLQQLWQPAVGRRTVLPALRPCASIAGESQSCYKIPDRPAFPEAEGLIPIWSMDRREALEPRLGAGPGLPGVLSVIDRAGLRLDATDRSGLSSSKPRRGR